MKILFSNLGYAKGISGSLRDHMAFAARYFYVSPIKQQKILAQFRAIIEREIPDLCCIVEIDSGSLHSGYFNQLNALMCERYCFHDIAGKYGENSKLGHLPLHYGKSNAFLARLALPFERHYFSHGSKRLIYKLTLPENRTLFFTHFSLQRKIRAQQFAELNRLIAQCPGDIIILADFNILHGTSELQPLLASGSFILLNRLDEPTFLFHTHRLVLDLCLCSPSVAAQAKLTVIPQPFSDHAALLLEL